MKNIFRTLIIGAIAFMLMPVYADWNPNEWGKFVNLPDLTTTGIDIDTDGCSIVADDFLCLNPGPVTDIHFWGSWLNDINGGVNTIRVRIFSDDRTGVYSKPGAVLWTGEIGKPGTVPLDGYFTERVYATVPGTEAFWKPNTPGMPQGMDTVVWQYNLYIDPLKAFVQEGTPTLPMIYWLELLVIPENPSTDFGWKTRDWRDGHFEDDAVFFSSTTFMWEELKYPQGDRWLPEPAGRSIDMAFVITPEPSSVVGVIVGVAAFGGFLIRRRR